MKRLKYCLLSGLLLGSISTTLFAVTSKPANAHCADYFPHIQHCFRNLDPTPELGRLRYFRVNIKNNSGRTINVYVRYKKSGRGLGNIPIADAWRTESWTFSPNENALILDHLDRINNRYIYVYAETVKGSKLKWTGRRNKPSSGPRGGRIIPMKKIDMGSKIGTFTYTFNR